MKLKRKLPFEIYRKISPLLGKQQEKKATKMIKAIDKGYLVAKLLGVFMLKEWIHETKGIKNLANLLTEEEKKTFFIAIEDIDQPKNIHLNNYGIQKYILKERVKCPIKPNEKPSLPNFGRPRL
jgi:hypothetical protein